MSLNSYSHFVTSGKLNVLQNAHSNTAGFLWLINPLNTKREIHLKYIDFLCVPTTNTTTLSIPRINIEKCTFTGTSTASPINPAHRSSFDPLPSGLIIFLSNGLNLNQGQIIHSFLVPPVLSGSTPYFSEQKFSKIDYDTEIVLPSGEGIVVRQADNGNNSDIRIFLLNICWSEI